MMGYERNRIWSDQYLEKVKQIIGPHLLEVSSFEVDTQQAADLVVLTGRNMTIGVRLRRPGYVERYPFDITFRAKLDNGCKTELSKIIDGWGDWFFYGHVDDAGNITHWLLICLKAFRAEFIRRRTEINKRLKNNHDGTQFLPVDVRWFPKIIIASSHSIPKMGAAA